jgi:hypothetical protein
MQSKELLTTALQQSYGMLMPLLEDLKSAALVSPTPNGGNHAHWILGHLVQSEGHFRKMMRGTSNPVDHLRPLFAGGTSPDPEGTGYPPYGDLLGKLIALREETMQWLSTLSENDLDQPSKTVPPGFEPFFGTWRQYWMNHRGQLADCRRSVGRERMMA